VSDKRSVSDKSTFLMIFMGPMESGYFRLLSAPKYHQGRRLRDGNFISLGSIDVADLTFSDIITQGFKRVEYFRFAFTIP